MSDRLGNGGSHKWILYAMYAASTGVVVAYMMAGDHLVETGVIGNTGWLAGRAISVLILAVLFVATAVSVWDDYRRCGGETA
ncbi:hypothetical protein [Halosolutus gelatinilyticus]|uniref:hypothetical protein n=1 Tax=Halosolutus gelatinilyticus TaxID=2931975 RepID=UPI001FF5DEF6|nr:hypothetical protein [Halosolutus gelatinilyticus]